MTGVTVVNPGSGYKQNNIIIVDMAHIPGSTSHLQFTLSGEADVKNGALSDIPDALLNIADTNKLTDGIKRGVAIGDNGATATIVANKKLKTTNDIKSEITTTDTKTYPYLTSGKFSDLKILMELKKDCSQQNYCSQ